MEINNNIYHDKEVNIDIKTFYNTDNYRNIVYALNLALETKYANELLKGDLKRVIYSLNDFAFRKRVTPRQGIVNPAEVTTNTLNFPFMNYKINKILNKTNRPYKNFRAITNGIFFEELQRNLKIVPVTLEYEATLWLRNDIDLQFIYNQLMFDSATETRVEYSVEILGQEIQMLGIINYELEYDPTYDEAEWISKNKIHSISLDFSVQTFMILDNLDISIPDKIIIDFYNGNDIISNTPTIEMTGVINHFTDTTTF